MVEQILAAVLVIALLLGTVWLLRRKGLASGAPVWNRAARPGSMQVLERLQLTSQHSLHLVRLGEQVILIGVSPATCSRIAVTAAPESSQMRTAL
jgi:flagellar biogenesis protein FliO